ncbi:sensor histidine kinase [Ornithinimicrobium sp. W1679]|uniref:sensor histidine kinase n=1 Tax=Ornithinimicrobium sp. W1679 TaxID=3418770 RepID=UPI003CF114BE
MGPWRSVVALALINAGVAAVLLPADGAARYAVPPAVALAVLVVGRAAWAGPVCVTAVQVMAGALGVPIENPALLLPTFVVVYAAGRHAGLWPGLGGVATLAAVSWGQDGFQVGTLIFVVLLLGMVSGFARLVRHRASRAAAAGEEAARVAARDPVAESVEVVLAERQRLATEAVALLQEAVTDMRRAAASAAASLDEAGLRSVHERGVLAVGELRLLLGLLREEGLSDAGSERPSPASEGAAPSRDRRVGRRTGAITALLALALVPVDVVGLPSSPPVAVVLGVLLALTPLLLNDRPLGVALLVGGLPLVALALGATPLVGFSLLVVVAAVGWQVGATGDRVLAAGLAAFLLSRILDVLATEPGNLAIELALVGLPVFAGAAWQDKDRAFHAARRRAEQLHGVHDAVVRRAVAQERLRVARDLHDVTSHAVGVMLLQAAAAISHRRLDPARSRAALEEVDRAGREALAELDALGRVLAQRRSGLQPEGDLRELVARFAGSGLQVDLEADHLPEDARTAAFVHLVVREALTNAARHAPGSQVQVHVDEEDSGWHVRVVDDGPQEALGEQAAGSGFGLLGLTERARAIGGAVTAGPGSGGGFEVEARVPHAIPPRDTSVQEGVRA